MKEGESDAVEMAVRSYISVKPEGVNTSNVANALAAWNVDRSVIERILYRLVHRPSTALYLCEAPEKAYPPEVSATEAARILGCSKDTVLKLKEAGLLEYRNLAPPTSIRGVFRFLLASVLELRNNYQTDFPTPPSLPQPQRRRVRQREQPKFKHLRLE